VPAYTPRRGDFVSLALDPQAGHEQRGRRPGLVLSHDLFNRRTGLAFVAPVTRPRRDYPFHVAIPDGATVTGYVMIEQTRSLDYRARGVKRIGPAPVSVLDEALALLDACLY
jgi:mRNA interferase MazF